MLLMLSLQLLIVGEN